MIGYLRYRSVLYWMSVVKNRESFCMNPAFFATAETVISRDEAIAAIRNAIPDGTLLWLQTHDDSHQKRLDFTSRMPDVLCTVWNHAPSREALRGVLLTAARKWLTLAESEGVEAAPSHPLDAREEIMQCIESGLLIPPISSMGGEEMAMFVRQASPHHCRESMQ